MYGVLTDIEDRKRAEDKSRDRKQGSADPETSRLNM